MRHRVGKTIWCWLGLLILGVPSLSTAAGEAEEARELAHSREVAQWVATLYFAAAKHRAHDDDLVELKTAVLELSDALADATSLRHAVLPDFSKLREASGPAARAEPEKRERPRGGAVSRGREAIDGSVRRALSKLHQKRLTITERLVRDDSNRPRIALRQALAHAEELEVDVERALRDSPNPTEDLRRIQHRLRRETRAHGKPERPPDEAMRHGRGSERGPRFSTNSEHRKP